MKAEVKELNGVKVVKLTGQVRFLHKTILKICLIILLRKVPDKSSC